jgi:predicted flavoprotein YhiN
MTQKQLILVIKLAAYRGEKMHLGISLTGCWLHTAGGCLYQGQYIVISVGGNWDWLLTAGGCLYQVAARAGSTVVKYLTKLTSFSTHSPYIYTPALYITNIGHEPQLNLTLIRIIF